MNMKPLAVQAEDIPFDYPKEPRQSLATANGFICIDIDRLGSGYRAIINGAEYALPDYVTNAVDAKQAACRLASRLANEAMAELLAICEP